MCRYPYMVFMFFFCLSVSESGIFGVPLQNLVQDDKIRNERTSIPSFFTEVQ